MDYQKMLQLWAEGENQAALLRDVNATMRDFSGQNELPFAKESFLRQYAPLGGLTPAEIDELIQQVHQLLLHPGMKLILFHSERLLYHYRRDDKESWILPDLSERYPQTYGAYYFLLIVARFPFLVDFYRKKGIPEQILTDTLSDLAVWVRHYKIELKLTGVTGRTLSWMQNHLSGILFRLGRLQFQKGALLGSDIHVFEKRDGQGIKVLAGHNVPFGADGWINEAKPAWRAIFRNDVKGFTGNIIASNGTAYSPMVELPAALWREVLRKNDPVLYIHIPAIGPMTLESCMESIKAAKAFFPHYFPSEPFHALVCVSWIIDPQLQNILPESSNLVRFQKSGPIFPTEHAADTLYRVLGPEAEKGNLDAVCPKTTMQQAVWKFAREGGIFRTGGIFFLKEQ